MTIYFSTSRQLRHVASGRVGSGLCGARAWQMVVVVVVVLVNPASTQTLLTLLSRLVQDLPALARAIGTSPRPTSAAQTSLFQARSGRTDDAVEHYCFGELGCLVTGAEFYHQQYRPINLEPESREAVSVLFTFRSQEDQQGVVVPALDVQQVLRSSFKPHRKTKFIVHGYLTGGAMSWMENIAYAFLRAGDYNTVSVDWTKGSLGLYGQAVANARVAGLEIAHLVNWLRDHTGLRPQDVHLIGHSLGAHVCGYAGERIRGLGRITGLDPAEPYFQHLPPSVRLDPSDALFVDVIHSDASPFSLDGGYGMREPAGHLDFYPNNGHHQPGCQPPLSAPLRWLINGNNFSKMWHAVEDALGCSHFRSVLLFTDSIGSQCPYMAFRCDSYKQYQNGKCFNCGKDGSWCAPMGLHADTWPGKGQTGLKLYVTTGPDNKYCLYHYRLRMKLGRAEAAAASMMGTINLSLGSNTGQHWHFNLTAGSPTRFESGKTYSFLLQHGEDLSSSQSARLTWSSKGIDHSCHPTCKTSLPLSTLSLLNIEKYVQRKRSSQSNLETQELVMCHGGTPGVMMLKSGDTVQLVATPTCSTPLQNNFIQQLTTRK